MANTKFQSGSKKAPMKFKEGGKVDREAAEDRAFSRRVARQLADNGTDFQRERAMSSMINHNNWDLRPPLANQREPTPDNYPAIRDLGDYDAAPPRNAPGLIRNAGDTPPSMRPYRSLLRSTIDAISPSGGVPERGYKKGGKVLGGGGGLGSAMKSAGRNMAKANLQSGSKKVPMKFAKGGPVSEPKMAKAKMAMGGMNGLAPSKVGFGAGNARGGGAATKGTQFKGSF